MRILYLAIITAITTLLCSTSFAANRPIQIDIQGIEGEIKQNVMEKLITETEHTNFDTWYQKSNENIKEAMAPYGYFTPHIERIVQRRNNIHYVRFFIVKGQPVIIRSIKIDVNGEGKFNEEINASIKNKPPTVGSILQTPQYETFKKNVLVVANEQGYIKSFWENSRIEVDLIKRRANITLILQTEKRYYFGAVTFHQSQPTYDSNFLQRFSLSAPKGFFSSKRLVDYQQQISLSPYFKEAAIAPNFSTSSTAIPLNADVTAPAAKKYTVGLGYSTWTGPRFLAGAAFRHLNNIGHYFETQLKLSSVISGFSAKYYIPGYNPLTQQWTIGANMQRFLPKNGSSTPSTFSVGYNVKNNNWQYNVALNYLHEQYKIINSNSQTSAFIYPSLNISRTQIDDPIYPSHGYNIGFMLRGATKAAMSSTSFFQGSTNAKYLFSLREGTRFIARGEAGYTAVNDVSNLPLSLRFFTGGGNSIRGYKDSSIGPGKYLLVGSVEVQQRIYGNWEMALFYDQGRASNHWGSPWSKSTGIGAIYASIIGPVKLYVARDISLKNKPYRIEFSFGPDF